MDAYSYTSGARAQAVFRRYTNEALGSITVYINCASLQSFFERLINSSNILNRSTSTYINSSNILNCSTSTCESAFHSDPTRTTYHRSRQLEAKLNKLEAGFQIMFDTLNPTLNTMQVQANSLETQLADIVSTFTSNFATLRLLVTEELNAKEALARRSR